MSGRDEHPPKPPTRASSAAPAVRASRSEDVLGGCTTAAGQGSAAPLIPKRRTSAAPGPGMAQKMPWARTSLSPPSEFVMPAAPSGFGNGAAEMLDALPANPASAPPPGRSVSQQDPSKAELQLPRRRAMTADGNTSRGSGMRARGMSDAHDARGPAQTTETWKRPEGRALRQESIAKKSGWLQVATLMFINKQAKLQKPSKRKLRKFWVSLAGDRLMLFTRVTESEDKAKLKAADAETHGSLDRCIAHRFRLAGSKPNKDFDNSFAVAFRTGHVLQPNVVLHFQAASSADADDWVRIVLESAAKQESLTTETAKCAAALKTRLHDYQSTLFNPRLDMHRKESTRLNVFRMKSYIASIQEDSREVDPSTLMNNLSTEMQEHLAKCTDVLVNPAGLCVLLHKMLLSDNSQTKKTRRNTGLLSETTGFGKRPSSGNTTRLSTKRVARVFLPGRNNKPVAVKKAPGMTCRELIVAAVKKAKLADPQNYVLQKFSRDTADSASGDVVPEMDTVPGARYSLCPKPIHKIKLVCHSQEHDQEGTLSFAFGLRLVVQKHGAVPIIIVKEFSEGSNAQLGGINIGDEILGINGVDINDNLKLAVQELGSKPEAVIKVRQHKRLDMVVASDVQNDVDEMINDGLGLFARPPPAGNVIIEEDSMISLMVCAPPPPSACFGDTPNTRISSPSVDNGKQLIQQYSSDVAALVNMTYPESFVEGQDASQLQYILNELLDTEKGYIKDLDILNRKYIAPILSSPLISPIDRRTLSECLPQLLKFQMQFAATLNMAIMDPDTYFKQGRAAYRAENGGDGAESVDSTPTPSRASSEDAASLIEESVYDTIQIVKAWEQPPVQQLYPQAGTSSEANATNVGRGGAAGVAAESTSVPVQLRTGPEGAPKNRLSREEITRSVYDVLEMHLPGNPRERRLNNGNAISVDAPNEGQDSVRLIKSLRAVADLFVSRQNEFRIYAEYCVWNYVAVRLLVTTDNPEMLKFCRGLDSRIVGGKALAGLNSFLIKPVQRVLKYPLLLQNMVKEIKKDDTYCKPFCAILSHVWRQSCVSCAPCYRL